MKKFDWRWVVAMVMLMSATAYAITNEFVVSNITNYKFTKIKTLAADPTTPIMVSSATVCRVFVNATSGSNGFLIPANTPTKLQASGAVTNFVFKCTSSAATAPVSLGVAK